MKNWIVYIVTHGPIYAEHYSRDIMFNNNNWKFFNVSNTRILNSKYDVINKTDINYIDLGKWWAESEAIYNIYKSGIYKNYDYIGFMHYDYNLKNNENNQITSLINLILQKEKFISFSTYNFKNDYNQHIMMDENYPNKLVGNGRNCYDTILSDYNNFFNKNIQLNDLFNTQINLCSSFLSNKGIFEDLMSFLENIIESKKLDSFDLNHEHRFQGGMMERYIGLYTSQLHFHSLELEHLYQKYK